MLGQCHRWWPNINLTSGGCIMSANNGADVLWPEVGFIVMYEFICVWHLAFAYGIAYGISVSVYYVAVRTIVLSRHGSNLARPVIIHDIIHGLIYMPSTPSCGFFGVSPDGNCAYVHWGFFTSNSKSIRRAIWFTWFSEPHECILTWQSQAITHPIMKWSRRCLTSVIEHKTVERTPYSVYNIYIEHSYLEIYFNIQLVLFRNKSHVRHWRLWQAIHLFASLCFIAMKCG